VDPNRQPGIEFDQIFISTAQFDHIENALSMASNTPHPVYDFNITVSIFENTEDASKAAVTLDLVTRDKPESLYKLHVAITAVIRPVTGQENMPVPEYARNMAPAALYPFLREAIAAITMRGRFGPIYLRPFNFLATTQVAVAGDVPPGKPASAKRKKKKRD
jgi:preprotein translocase subunit SecB